MPVCGKKFNFFIDMYCHGSESFAGKMSKRQEYLIFHALNQFRLEVGDIYPVGFYEIADVSHYYGITVEITKVNPMALIARSGGMAFLFAIFQQPNGRALHLDLDGTISLESYKSLTKTQVSI